MPTPEQLRNRFIYHAASPPTREKHEYVSDMTLEMAGRITHTCKDSRQRAVALTKLEEVRMWWNAAVAMDGQEFPPELR